MEIMTYINNNINRVIKKEMNKSGLIKLNDWIKKSNIYIINELGLF